MYGLPYTFSYEFNTRIESRYSFRCYTSIKINTSSYYTGKPASNNFKVYLERETWYGTETYKESWNYNSGSDTCHFSGLDSDSKYFFVFTKVNDGAWVIGNGTVSVW